MQQQMRKKLNRLGVIVKFERFPSASRLKVKINRKGNATQKLIVIFKHLKILIVKLVDYDWHIFNCFSNFHKTLVTAITLLSTKFFKSSLAFAKCSSVRVSHRL